MVPVEMIQNPQLILITYANHSIPVTVWFEERNRLRITVEPDKTIVVKAPLTHTMEEVQAKLEKRTPWIFHRVRQWGFRNDCFIRFNGDT